MNLVNICRLLLPIVAILITLAGTVFLKPSRKILILAICTCWIPGTLNALVDIFEEHFGFWHYTLGNPYALPIDLYISVSLIIGIVLPLLCVRLFYSSKKRFLSFLMILPFYFLLQDYVVESMSGGLVVIWDNPYWWIADFISLMVILYTSLGTFFYLKKKLAY